MQDPFAILICNDGPRIQSTNYWATPHAAKGLLYLSWNAGAARLLVPAAQRSALLEMESAEYVAIRVGYWPAGGGEAFELLFEDRSEAPYAVHLQTVQSDRLPPGAPGAVPVLFSAWTEAGVAFERPAFYQRVAQLPFLQPIA